MRGGKTIWQGLNFYLKFIGDILHCYCFHFFKEDSPCKIVLNLQSCHDLHVKCFRLSRNIPWSFRREFLPVASQEQSDSGTTMAESFRLTVGFMPEYIKDVEGSLWWQFSSIILKFKKLKFYPPVLKMYWGRLRPAERGMRENPTVDIHIEVLFAIFWTWRWHRVFCTLHNCFPMIEFIRWPHCLAKDVKRFVVGCLAEY